MILVGQLEELTLLMVLSLFYASIQQHSFIWIVDG